MTDRIPERLRLPFDPFNAPVHRDFLLTGGDPAILLIHGYPGTPAEMLPLGQVLHSRGWTCRGLLLPGFGEEFADLPRKTEEDWQGSIVAAFHALSEQHSPVILCGHSLGGALAVIAAAQLRPDGLILLAPLWRQRAWYWNILPIIKVLIPRIRPFIWVRTEIDDPRLRAQVQDFFPDIDLSDRAHRESLRALVLPTAMFAVLRQVGKAAWQLAPDVDCPALVIQGTRDATIHLDDTRALAANLAGDVTWFAVDGADHELPFSRSQFFPKVRDAVIAYADKLLIQSEKRRQP